MSVCKYCGKVELSFDPAVKSKTGKMIPLDKQSGLPHQCAENPYSQKQSQQQTDAPKLAQSTNSTTSSTSESQQDSQIPEILSKL